MKPMTSAEKFNMLRPSVFFDDWRECGRSMKAALVFIYAMYVLAGLIAVAGVAVVLHLLFNGEWALLLVVLVICLALTSRSKK